jgi:pyruvate kinase
MKKKVKGMKGFDAMMHEAIKRAKNEKYIRRGQRVVITAGLPLGTGGTTNMLRVVEV